MHAPLFYYKWRMQVEPYHDTFALLGVSHVFQKLPKEVPQLLVFFSLAMVEEKDEDLLFVATILERVMSSTANQSV